MSRSSVPHGSKFPDVVTTSPLLCKPAEKRAFEARNGLAQFDEVVRQIEQSRGVLGITPETLKRLQQLAIQDIYPCAGAFRTHAIYIGGSIHQPPESEHVERHVQEMCDYANNGTDRSPVHIAAYLMWRLNWIHPFAGGNGRTSRAVSYLGLCVRIGFVLPGKLTIPEQIVANRQPYYDALDAADAAYKEDGRIDVSKMEELLAGMLAKQLLQIHDAATGRA